MSDVTACLRIPLRRRTAADVGDVEEELTRAVEAAGVGRWLASESSRTERVVWYTVADPDAFVAAASALEAKALRGLTLQVRADGETPRSIPLGQAKRRSTRARRAPVVPAEMLAGVLGVEVDRLPSPGGLWRALVGVAMRGVPETNRVVRTLADLTGLGRFEVLAFLAVASEVPVEPLVEALDRGDVAGFVEQAGRVEDPSAEQVAALREIAAIVGRPAPELGPVGAGEALRREVAGKVGAAIVASRR